MKRNHKILRVGLLFAFLALFCACSKDDASENDNNGNSNSNNATYTETAVSEAPAWQIDWTGNQERPNWTELDFSAIYENWTILKVQIEETLQPYTSAGDLLALFVNGQLRGLAKTAVNVSTGQAENGKFVLKAWGNETGTEKLHMSLQYYCQTLKQLFTLSGDISLNSDVTIGIDKAYIPEFKLGSAKYPVVKTVDVEPLLTKVALTPVSGNTVAAFVGEECRGTVILSASGSTQLLIFGRNAGESVTLKCYDATRGVVYTIPNAVQL